MDVQWREVSVTIRGKQILAPCSGQAQSGRMTALMGPSGSGKSTLLSCLREVISHAGEVRYDGAKFAPALRQAIGFTEQDDVVIPQLTVRQGLRFLADLRFGIGSKTSLLRVDAALAALRLERIADSPIGDASSGQRISGGERRRLCIARELLADPRLLLCDEPTSGLDSTMANQVVASMRQLCDSGTVTVMASIHQPSTSIFNRFDDLVLLREGRVLYSGPAADAETLFTSHGLSRAPAQSTSEFLMDLLVLGDDAPCAMSSVQCEELASIAHRHGAGLPVFGCAASWSSDGNRRYDASFWRQLNVLTGRSWVLLRSQVFTKAAASQNLGLMLVAALLWIQLAPIEQNIRARWGLCMWTLGTWMFFPLFGSLFTFSSQRRVLEKELSVGCYSLSAFYVARTILVLPLDLAWPTIWTTGVYWISNVNQEPGRFVLVLLLVYLSFCVFQGLGLAIGASPLSASSASTMTLILITFFFGWSGFFVDEEQLPRFLRSVVDVNPFRYAVHLMATIVMPDDLIMPCGDSTNEACEYIDGVRAISGQRAKAQLSISAPPWVGLCVLIAALVIGRVLAFMFLRHDLWTAVHGASSRHQSCSTALVGDPATLAPFDAVSAAAADEGFAAAVEEGRGQVSDDIAL